MVETRAASEENFAYDANDNLLIIDPDKVRSLGTYWTLYRILLFLFLITVFVSLVGSAGHIYLFSDWFDSSESLGLYDTFEIARALGLGLMYLLLLPCFILYAMFMHRAVLNVRLCGADDMNFTPVWSWAFLLVPILGLFKPYMAVSQTWSISHRLSHVKSQGRWQILVWWVLFNLSFLGISLAVAITPDFVNDNSVDAFVLSQLIYSLAMIMMIASVVFLMNVFDRISFVQNRLKTFQNIEAFN